VVHGTADRMLPPSNGEVIAAAIPGARLELLEAVGHLFWWEQPERSAVLVREHALVGV
jgi:pimeloyl-ACP methyl ester carboxylesterase